MCIYCLIGFFLTSNKCDDDDYHDDDQSLHKHLQHTECIIFCYNISNFIRITVNTRLQFKVYFIGCYLARNLKSSQGDCITFSNVLQLKLQIRSNATHTYIHIGGGNEMSTCEIEKKRNQLLWDRNSQSSVCNYTSMATIFFFLSSSFSELSVLILFRLAFYGMQILYCSSSVKTYISSRQMWSASALHAIQRYQSYRLIRPNQPTVTVT